MKDLKKEYEELILPEIPDLWDRIEAALPVEEAPALVQEEVTVPVETTTKSNVKPFNKAKLYRWSSIAAACLCACIVLPIALKDVQGCGSSEETAAYDNAPAAMEAAPMEEYEMAATEAAVESADDGYHYSDVMEEAAAEEVQSPAASVSESTNDWGNDTLNIWDAESVDNSPSKGATTELGETAPVFEVTAIIESEIFTDGDITGYSLLITEYLSDSLNIDRIVGYFSEEFTNRLDEYDIVLENEYVVHLRINEEKQRFEIVDLQ